MEKCTHKEVHYRGGNVARHCAACRMYRAINTCTAVESPIDMAALCDLFQKSEQGRRNYGKAAELK